MKFLFVIIFNFLSIYSFAQSLSMIVLDNNQPVIGVSIYVNGNIKTVTNEQGKAQLMNLNDGDTIRTVYLGYKPEIILYSSQKKELTISLTQEIFDLRGVVVSSKNDRSLFKKMLKWGLEESTIYKSTPFYTTDTLCFLEKADTIYGHRKGSFTYPMRGCEITIQKLLPELLYTTSETDSTEKTQIENYIKRTKWDIGKCTGFPYRIVTFHRDIRWIYMGKGQEGFEEFYFYIPNNDWIYTTTESRNKAYFGGIVYLDSEGVINKIKVHKTALDSSVIGYEFDIDYIYNEKKNKITPCRALMQTYMLDKEMKVTQINKSYLEIYSEKTISTGANNLK